MNWNDSEFDELASELRQKVGGEFRMEAEAVEEDAAKLVLRKRDLADVVLEFLNRGDVVGISALDVSYTGVVSHAAGDLTIIDTPHSLINVNLGGPISLHVERRAQSGGRSRANGSQSYRSRMLELEITGENVEIISSGSRSIEGTISVVGADHIVLIDRNDTEWFIPLSTIALTLQRR